MSRGTLIIVFILTCLPFESARAACSTPSANVGSLDFQSGAFAFCDGTNWQGLLTNGSLGYIGGITMVGKASCNWTATTSWGTFAANTNCNALSAEGSATSPGKYPAITLPSLTAGTYRVTFNIAMESGTQYCAFRITDGTNTSGVAFVNGNHQDSVSGVFVYASAQGSTTFSLQAKAAAASDCLVYGDNSTSGFAVTDFVYRFYVEKLK